MSVDQRNTQFCLETATVGADVLCEFLEVSIHSILYLRDLYPRGVFEKRKKYNVPVQMCLHPDVCKYVVNIVDSVHRLNQLNQVEKIAMVILGPDHRPLERFVIEIGRHSDNMKGDDRYLYQLEQSLRAFLLKLNVSDALLQPLPKDCTWAIQVETTESAADSINDKQMVQGFPWVEAEGRETTLDEPNIIPLRAVTSDFIKMQMFVEETTKKS
ncbi:mitotic spindle assembly checkpoint protein MAD2B-like isoform X2 [Mizuhopecten yessoensis]|uniref:Mitotic spindle assembly checkpoint protein MAD2B n=1 Tax=Mizuhopecten yessoensis TaxID=6573 RepID=A0A210QDF3_MIZYE|nr:mitotic spindle assembly checkpoint protein MAD2B-like isoform X2 [Mizuhopecten yessoensis]OWF46718.1 Mitotic spindle assembly checkpoint protein MAD2B [Mizuhopecten yessoensis]